MTQDHRSSTEPRTARIWRGRVAPGKADAYERYLLAEGIPPLRKTALAVQLFREDRAAETEFVTTSYWPDIPSRSEFTGGDPNVVHHLPRDAEFLIELPQRIEVLRIIVNTLP
jgi:hypothetical protein